MEYRSFFSKSDINQLALLECQLTYTCNIRCQYCFNPHHQRGRELTLEEWTRVFQDARSLGARACVFNGGEPLLDEDCVELIKRAHSTGMQTAISTNGMLLTPDKLLALVPHLSVLQISVHPWRYIDNIRPGLQEFVDSVAAFKRYGGSSAVFNVVLYKGLSKKLDELLRTIADLGAGYLDMVGIQVASPFGQGYLNPDSIPSLAECEAAAEIIKNCQRDLSLRIDDKVSNYFSVGPNTWGSYGVIVNPEGYVYPLIEGADTLAFIFKEFTFDNLRERPLADIWRNSEVLNKFRGLDWHRAPCLDCHIQEQCRGGNRLRAFVLTKDMYVADPFCNLSPDHERIMQVYRDRNSPVLVNN